MKYSLFFVLLLFFVSCTDSNLAAYEQTIDQANRIQIEYKAEDKTVDLNEQQIAQFKEILKRNIEPAMQAKFKAAIQINLFSGDSRIGFMMVSDKLEQPLVNFHSGQQNFGFPLTYGIGRYLDEIKKEN